MSFFRLDIILTTTTMREDLVLMFLTNFLIYN